MKKYRLMACGFTNLIKRKPDMNLIRRITVIAVEVPVAVITFDCSDWTVVDEMVNIEGVHDIFWVTSGDFEFDEWQFVEK